MIAVISTIYVALRVWRLDASCLWFDEIFSVHAAEHDWSGMFVFVARDMVHPPLFYAVLKSWIGIGGEDLFWLRMLPVLLSVIAVVPFLLLCRELALRNSTTVIALFLFAMNGAMIKYAQTLRMYTMLMCIALFSARLFLRYCRTGKGILALTIVNILLVYTQYFGWMVVFCEFAYVIAFHRDRFKAATVSAVITFVSFLPWVAFVLSSRASEDSLSQNIGWQLRPGIRELFTFAIDLVEPVYFQSSNVEPASIYAVSLPILFAVFAAGVYFLGRKRNENENHILKFLVVFIAVPLVLTFIASWILPLSLWGTRHMIVIVPATIIAFALIFDSLEPHWLRAIAVTMLVVFAGYATVSAFARTQEPQVWCAWVGKGATEPILPRPLKIVTLEGLVAYHVWFEFRNEPGVEIKRINGIDERVDESAYFIPRGFDGVKVVELESLTDDRFLLAFRSSSRYKSTIFDRFRHAGYFPCTDRTEIYGKTNVYFVEMTKKAEMCSRP